MRLVLVLALATIAVAGRAELLLGTNSRPCVIVLDPKAIASEQHAAQELAAVLQQSTGISLAIVTNTEADGAIFIGNGAAAKAVFGEARFARLGEEELVTSGMVQSPEWQTYHRPGTALPYKVVLQNHALESTGQRSGSLDSKIGGARFAADPFGQSNR